MKYAKLSGDKVVAVMTTERTPRPEWQSVPEYVELGFIKTPGGEFVADESEPQPSA